MRDVNFIEVGMKNFGPYIDPMVLQFPNDSLTLITGPNGIGKTMALDALSFTLYGVTSKGAKGDDVVNNVIGRNCKTWATFTINSDSYKVIRYHKYTKLNNTVTISKNGEKPYKKGHREVLPEVERLLCPKKSFMNTLMFGQKVKDFFTDLIDSDKKEIFRMILNIDRYQVYYAAAKQTCEEIEAKITDLKNKIQIQQGLLQDAKEQSAILENNKKKFYEQKEEDIRNITKSIENSQRMQDQWQQKVNDLKAKQEDWKETEQKLLQFEKDEAEIDLKFKSKQQDLLDKKELKISELKLQAKEAEQQYTVNSMESEQEKKDYFGSIKDKTSDEITQIMENKSAIDTKLYRIEDAIINAEIQIRELEIGLEGNSCPTCLQTITEDCKQNLLSKIEIQAVIIDESEIAKEIALKEKRAVLHDVQKLVEKKESIQKTLRIDLKDIELILLQQQQNSDQKLNTALDKVDEISKQHSEAIKLEHQEQLKPIYHEMELLMKIARKHQNLEKEIDEAEMSLQTVQRAKIQRLADLRSKEGLEFDDTQIFSYEKRQREIEIAIKEIEKELDELMIDLEAFEFWKVGFSPRGIPSMLIDESIPFMNEKVSEYLEKLTNGRYIVSFDTLAETKSGEFRDKISVNVLDTHTRANSRIQLSGGQTRIIDIATILTLGDLQSNIQGVKFNILLFDEIFDSLDDENIGFVSKVLSNMKIGKSVYLISHRHEDQLEADEVLTLN